MREIRQIIERENKDTVFRSFKTVYRAETKSKVRYWFYGIAGLLIVILFLPWTQNIRARGAVTTLRQEQRPQELNTVIAGKIVQWYVKEGDYVQAGDTIVRLAEIKDNYLDPHLLGRTEEQIDAKAASISSYRLKADAAVAQIGAIEQAKELKLRQLRNKIRQLELKIVSDSMELVAAGSEHRIAEEQYRRLRIMRDSGLASMVQLEQRSQALQNTLAKKISAEIKLQNTRTDLSNVALELSQAEQEYNEKILKARGEIAAAQSEIALGKGELAKLSNQYANYSIRAGQYYLLAPQSGQVVRASRAGINEIVKEGEKLVEIVPKQIDYAVEMFVRPVDLPLLSPGQRVRFLFDGFPAIVFSGWPEASYGTFSGKVVAIENAVSPNGKFRVLVSEDPREKPWPRSLKMGAGASGIALLRNVPVWYELWRNINGFPPDYYKPQVADDGRKKG